MNNKGYLVRYFFIRVFRVIIIFFSLIFLLLLCLITYIDRSDVTETSAYQETMKALNNFKIEDKETSNDTLKVGWGKVNFTPDSPVELAGYGARKQKTYEVVHDSVFVRAFVFEQGEELHAMVSADLLIFPPEVIKVLESKLPQGISLSNTYFSATHTHSSIGHWQTGFVGELFAGGFDPNMVDHIANKVVQALEIAVKNTEKAVIGYQKVEKRKLIKNRLTSKGVVDPWLRIINIDKITGEKAVIFSYAAHATCLSYSFSKLSGDYPGQVVNDLEKENQVDFAAYMAGAVASMSTDANGLRGFKRVDYVAKELKNTIINQLPTIKQEPLNQVIFNDFPFDAGKPQFKVTEDLKVRGWVFNQLFGRNEMEITSMKLGNILFIGVPCDFSGELVAPLEELAAEKGLDLVITSFNGGYAGYVTKDEWYDLNKYETRTMNWYGAEIGQYLTEVIEKIILGYATNN